MDTVLYIVSTPYFTGIELPTRLFHPKPTNDMHATLVSFEEIACAQERRHIAHQALLEILMDEVERIEDAFLSDNPFGLYIDGRSDSKVKGDRGGGNGRIYPAQSLTAGVPLVSSTSSYAPLPHGPKSVAHYPASIGSSPSTTASFCQQGRLPYDALHHHLCDSPRLMDESCSDFADDSDDLYDADDEDTLGHILTALRRTGSYSAPRTHVAQGRQLMI